MQRHFVKNARFWEISRIGARYTARWGDVNTPGEVTVYDFNSEEEACDSLEALIESLVDNGYSEHGSMHREDLRWSAEFEAAIIQRPNEASARLVYGDWLQANGNPLGQLIALQHAGQSGATFIQDHFVSFFGRNAARLRRPGLLVVEWKNGFVDAVRAHGQGLGDEMSSALSDVLTSPATRFVRSITLGTSRDDDDYDLIPSAALLLAEVVARAPAMLERLEVADFSHTVDTELWASEIGDASGLWRAVPSLQEVIFRGAVLEVGDIDAPELRSFTIESERPAEQTIRSVLNAKWPQLESLAIKNTESTDALIETLADSNVLRQVRTLDLSKGAMTAEGTKVLKAKADRFRHLELINLGENRHDLSSLIQGLDLKIKT